MRQWHRAPRTPAALLAALALLLGAVGKGRADLVFSTLRAELGEIRSGARLGYSFSFVNRGTEPVEIVEARPGCGCLRPRLERLVFRPGEEGTIPLATVLEACPELGLLAEPRYEETAMSSTT